MLNGIVMTLKDFFSVGLSRDVYEQKKNNGKKASLLKTCTCCHMERTNYSYVPTI